MGAFDEAMTFVFGEEGGVSDNPNDAGGFTVRGVTEGTAHRAYAANLAHSPDATTWTREEFYAVYRALYWNASGADRCPAPVDLAVFDAAVNCGVGASVKMLQNALNRYLADPVAEDGGFGPQTSRALSDLVEEDARSSGGGSALAHGCLIRGLIDSLLQNRADLYAAITDGVNADPKRKAQEVKNRAFLRGWYGRLQRLGDAVGT